MNKSEMIDRIVHKSDISRSTVSAVVDHVFDEITDALAKGEEARFVGFGTFEARCREAREGRNPQTGEPVQIPAQRVPKFAAGKGFKTALNA
ncbi:MAG: HU family DNA-binding protein [Alphaproteobacteria bacterium]